MILDLPPMQQAPAAAQCEAVVEASVEQAAAARRDGRFADAARIASCVLQLHPGDSDAWFELGAANAALGEREEARRSWLRTLELAPSNDDARLGLARLAWQDGDPDAARRWLGAVNPARLTDPEVRQFQLALDQAARPSSSWRLDASAALSRLTQDLPDWTEARASLIRRQGATSLGAAIEYARHFDIEDVYAEVLATHEIGPVVLSLAVGGAPQADFRPELSARIGAEHYAKHWHAGAFFTHAEYPVGPVGKFDVRLAHDVGAGVRLRVSGVALNDENGDVRSGYGLGADWSAAPGLVLDAGWSDAPETSDGVTVDVRSAVLGATFEISPDLRIRAGLVREMRDAYDRTEVSVGIARTY